MENQQLHMHQCNATTHAAASVDQSHTPLGPSNPLSAPVAPSPTEGTATTNPTQPHDPPTSNTSTPITTTANAPTGSSSPLPPPLEPLTGFAAAPILSISDCFYCNTKLQFPIDANDVQCPNCLNVMRPVRRFNTTCPSCHQYLQYDPAAATFQCPQCAEIITAPRIDENLLLNMNKSDEWIQTIQRQQLYQQLHSNTTAAMYQASHPMHHHASYDQSSNTASLATTEESFGKVVKPRKKQTPKSEYELSHKPPKRPISAKQLYSKEHRKEFKSNHPNVAPKEINNQLHQAYEQLPPTQKQEIKQRVQTMRQEYDLEMSTYEAARAAFEQSATEAKESNDGIKAPSETPVPQSAATATETQFFLPLTAATLPVTPKLTVSQSAASFESLPPLPHLTMPVSTSSTETQQLSNSAQPQSQL